MQFIVTLVIPFFTDCDCVILIHCGNLQWLLMLVSGMSIEGGYLIRCFGLHFGMLFANLHGISIGMLHDFAVERG
jgi:hypothetical protein